MQMDKKLTSNFLYNLVYQFLTIALPLVTAPYISRVLGPKGVGEFNYVNSIVSYFGVFAILGTFTYGQREISRSRKYSQKLNKQFSSVLLFRFLSTSLVCIFYFLFSSFLMKSYHNVFVAAYFLVLSWAIDVSWYFQGVENFKVTAIRNGLVKVFATVCVFIFVKGRDGVVVYMLIYAASTLLGNLTMLPFLKGKVRLVKVGIQDLYHTFKGALVFFIPVIAIQIFNTLNKVMLGSLGETKEVGYFSQAVSIVNLCIDLIYALASVLLPRLSFLYDQKQIDKLKKFMNIGIRNVFLMAMPMVVGCIAVADKFVPIFFGPGYRPVIKLLMILSLLFLIVGIGQILGVYLLSINRQWQNTFAVLVAVFVNILANFIALKADTGALGVSVVTLITESVSTIIQMMAIRDYIKINVYIRAFKTYFFPTLTMGAVLVVVNLVIRQPLISLIVSIFAGIVCYFGQLFLNKDPFVTSIFKNN